MHPRSVPDWLRHPPTPSVRGFGLLSGIEAIARGILISVMPLEIYRALGAAARVSEAYFLVGLLSLGTGLMVPWVTRFVPRGSGRARRGGGDGGGAGDGDGGHRDDLRLFQRLRSRPYRQGRSWALRDLAHVLRRPRLDGGAVAWRHVARPVAALALRHRRACGAYHAGGLSLAASGQRAAHHPRARTRAQPARLAAALRGATAAGGGLGLRRDPLLRASANRWGACCSRRRTGCSSPRR